MIPKRVFLALGMMIAAVSNASVVFGVQAREPLLVAYAGHNETVAPMWVGIEAGLFKKYGLDVGMLQTRSGPLLMSTLASGSVQVVYTASSSALSAAAAGLKVSCVAFPINKIARHLTVRKDIAAIEDLRGRIFGVQSVGGGFWLQTMLLLDHLGIDPEKYQLKFRVIGDTATITQALITGQVDAAVLPYSFSERARRMGFHSLADAAEIKRPLPVTGLCAQREFLLRSRDLVTRLIQGMIEAVVSARNPRNRSDVMEVLRKNLRFDKAEDTEMSYRVLTQVSTLDVDLYEDAWRLTQRIVSRVNPKLGQVDLSQLLDRSFVRSLEESGFLPEMRKKMGS